VRSSLAISAAVFALSCASAPLHTSQSAVASPSSIWIKDDLDRALAASREKQKAIVAIVCGDWSSSCRALRKAMHDAVAVGKLQERFVWLDLETESERGARAIAPFGVADGAEFWLIQGDRAQRCRGVVDPARIAAMIERGDLEDGASDDREREREDAKPLVPHADSYDELDRRARAAHEAGREDEALDAIDRALSLAHGPYRIVLFARKADIALARGDRDGARAAIESALELGRPLALSGRFAHLRARLEVRLSEWNHSQR
jgi:hypothetical protein